MKFVGNSRAYGFLYAREFPTTRAPAGNPAKGNTKCWPAVRPQRDVPQRAAPGAIFGGFGMAGPLVYDPTKYEVPEGLYLCRFKGARDKEPFRESAYGRSDESRLG